MRTLKEMRKRGRRAAIKIATAYLAGYTFWVLLSAFGVFGFPYAFFTFLAGVEFEYLAVFVIEPLSRNADPFDV